MTLRDKSVAVVRSPVRHTDTPEERLTAMRKELLTIQVEVAHLRNRLDVLSTTVARALD